MSNSTFGGAASEVVAHAKGFDVARVSRALEGAAVLITAIGAVIAAAEKVDEKWAHWQEVRNGRKDRAPAEPAAGLDAA